MMSNAHNGESTFDLSNEDFYEPIKNNLQQIQTLFDAYQQACFQARPPEFFALELCGEAGELANLEKKRWKGKAVNPHDISDEAADVLIALMNFANASGINLGEAVRAKLIRIENKRQRLAEQDETY
ncbi:MAG: hypothetical protein MUF71_14200 [Candidatus Kapabacteria bacterium]|jgi:NTP pyrophosphatase (non-canonical NTP hydrolase)|nr:hypothetical protein [Candidatus Kapabacteria bacterium]